MGDKHIPPVSSRMMGFCSDDRRGGELSGTLSQTSQMAREAHMHRQAAEDPGHSASTETRTTKSCSFGFRDRHSQCSLQPPKRPLGQGLRAATGKGRGSKLMHLFTSMSGIRCN